MEHCQIYKQQFRQQICCLVFSSLKHCERLNLISQCHCLPGVIDAQSPPVSHKPGHCVIVYSNLTAGRDRKRRCTQINRDVNSKLLNLILPISSQSTEFAILLLGPSGRKWFGKFSLKKFKRCAYPSGSPMFIQQNSCFKCFINGSNVNKALLNSFPYESYNRDFLMVDRELNTTANYA